MRSGVSSGQWEEKDNRIPTVAESPALALIVSEGAPNLLPNWHDPKDQASIILTMCKFLRARDSVFGDLIYSDPSWEILLLLHAARTEGVQVCFAQLVRALPASADALKRCFALLETNGLVRRTNTEAEATLALSGNALAMIEQSFARIPPKGSRVWENGD